MSNYRYSQLVLAAAIAASAGFASASLMTASAFTGPVGMSVDGIGSNETPVGFVQAKIPVGATILRAYLYSAGLPSPFYLDAPTTVADYNAAGITLAGTAITTFDTIVGATSTRADIGRWYTGRADVTALVTSLTTGAGMEDFSWAVSEGSKNGRIDGELLAIAYSLPGLAEATVAFLDGGQDTGGETTTVSFDAPLTDPSVPAFAAQLGLGISFSCCGQLSTISVNGSPLTDFAGNFDDGLALSDGSLFTVGGLGDDPSNNVADYDDDDELYDLKPFLSTGDTSFVVRTVNPTGDDNIFFASLYITAKVKDINDDPVGVPAPSSYPLVLLGLGLTAFASRRRRAQR